jgi:hypothetical protein
MTLSREHRRFLVLDQGVAPTIFNFVLNGAIAWLSFRSVSAVPLWGQSSIAADTLVTAFVLPVLTSFIVGALVERQVGRGHVPRLAASQASSSWARRSRWQRGAALGLAAVVLAASPVVLVFALAGPTELERWSFIWFKATFAAALGALVTPVIGWWALAAASRPDAAPS